MPGAQQHCLLLTVIPRQNAVARFSPQRRAFGEAHHHRITGRDLSQQGRQIAVQRIDHHPVLTGEVLHVLLQLGFGARQMQRFVEQSRGNHDTLLGQHARQHLRPALIRHAAIEPAS
jgi:hypothetical protein